MCDEYSSGEKILFGLIGQLYYERSEEKYEVDRLMTAIDAGATERDNLLRLLHKTIPYIAKTSLINEIERVMPSWLPKYSIEDKVDE